MTKRLLLCVLLLALSRTTLQSQSPTSCASVASRANSNGQATSCPAGGTGAIASNFSGTPYAGLPSGSKTGNLEFSYSGATTSLQPFAITKVWLTTTSTAIYSVTFGPASPPFSSGGNIAVDYCFYNNNLPPSGTLSFQLTNPQTGVVWGICSYDASCTANCSVVANPPGVLPVVFSSFQATSDNGNVLLEWATDQEQNNKGFAIERSLDDGNFTGIGFVASSNPGGNSAVRTSYFYYDWNVATAGTYQYRLRQIDLDGQSTYSNIVAVHRSEMPVSIRTGAGRITVSFNTGAATPCNVLLYDTRGRKLFQGHTVMSGEYTLPFTGPTGLYLISVTPSGRSRQLKTVYLEHP